MLKSLTSINKSVVYPALSILFISAVYDLIMLGSYSYAVGVDGYFYVLQISELRNNGHLYFQTHSPLVIYFLTGIDFLTNDPVWAVKIGAILLHQLASLGIYCIIKRITGSPLYGIIGIVLMSVLGPRWYLISEFINNLGAVTLLVWGAWCALQINQSKRYLLFSLLCLLGAVLSHRSAIGIILVMAAISILLLLISSRWISKKKPTLALLSFILLVSPIIVRAQPFFPLPDWILEETSVQPQLPIKQARLGEDSLLILSASVMLVMLFAQKKSEYKLPDFLFLGAITLWSLAFTLNPFISSSKGGAGIAERLRGLEYLQIAIILPCVFYRLKSKSILTFIYGAALTTPLILLSSLSPLPLGMSATYLSKRAELIDGLILDKGRLDPNSLVIAPFGEQYVVTYFLAVRSQHDLPSCSRQSVYWLLHDVNVEDLLQEGIVVPSKQKSSHTVFIEQQQLFKSLQSMPDVEKKPLIIVNPQLRKLVTVYCY